MRPRKQQRAGMMKYDCLQPAFVNRDILKLTIKGPGQISKLLQIEITHYDEMNNKIFDIDIDINVWDNARNVIEPISFHRFQGQSNSTIYI
jgi:hypothetical protein